ncbi:MAG: hypothetical protein MR210_07090 [Erysipelotrichaceae bacterium]|nr:hypothetical protein [Erysipelotrichaceae bacterium]MDY5252185.1 hypothetical protein [Erysipelotrichaceae bacterium]
MELVAQLIILFFIFAVLGWMMEVILKYIQFHRFINRGFLIGPYCPIYGGGVVAVTILVGDVVGYNGTIIETFFAGMVICGILEYFTSWYMEKLFHARWWDYSQKPMNLYGRVWIGNLILFGLGSLIIVKGIAPYYFNWISQYSITSLKIVAFLIVIVIVSDLIISHVLLNIVRQEIDGSDGDDTEEISVHIHELLKDRNLLIRRIHEAYPNLEARPLRLTKKLKEAKKEIAKLKKELKHAKLDILPLEEQKKLKQRYEQQMAELKKLKAYFHDHI